MASDLELAQVFKEVILSLQEVSGDIRELTNELKHTVESANENKKDIKATKDTVGEIAKDHNKILGGLKLVQIVGIAAVSAYATMSWWAFQNIIATNTIVARQSADIEYLKKDKK